MDFHPMIRALLCGAFVFLLGAPSQAQGTFEQVASEVGLSDDYHVALAGFGSGVAAADFDDDGDVDLFFSTKEGEAKLLYRNLGNGSFEEVAGQLGITATERARTALWLDYNGDHRLDLLIATDCYRNGCEELGSALRLFAQGSDGMFTEVTAAAGLEILDHTIEEHRSGLAAGDVNGDGYLDVVAGFWLGRLHLYLNQGDGTFADVSLVAGLDDLKVGYHQPIVLDFNGDGLQDIFTSVDFTENRLWLNQGNVAGVPTFLERGQVAGCDNAMNDMGVAPGDMDGDGDLDFYITNIFRDGWHNILLRNDGSDPILSYSEVSAAAAAQNGGWGWGTTFFDVDNDRDLDLAETNGWRNNWREPPRLYLRTPGVEAYDDQAAAWGLTDDSWGTSLVAVDFDRDGDLDLVETITEVNGSAGDSAIRLHRNTLDGASGDRRYLVLKPRMAGANGRGIGSKVEVTAAGTTMSRWISAGTSYLGQEPAEAHFGLGSAGVADRVTVTWPRGEQTVLWSVAADQQLVVEHSHIFASGFESGDLSQWAQ